MNVDEWKIKKSLFQFEKRFFSRKIHLLYEGHIPVVAFLISNGLVELYSKKLKISQLGEGEFIGLTNLLEHSPMTCTVHVLPSTEVFVLDRSTLIELLGLKNLVR